MSLRDGGMVKGAEISPCGTYRYRLWRHWGDSYRRLTFVMLNPSTADAKDDDPTIRKCMGFARRLGYSGISIVNLFALRATDPRELTKAEDPVGPENDETLRTALATAHRFVVAWGASTKAKKVFQPRRDWFVEECRPLIDDGRALCLGTTKSGEPRHPLMLSYDTSLERWRP